MTIKQAENETAEIHAFMGHVYISLQQAECCKSMFAFYSGKLRQSFEQTNEQ